MYDVGMIREMLETAGRLALHHFLNVIPTLKPDHSYVTEADRAVQAFLKKALDAHFPGDGIVAEEDNLRKAPSSGNRFWIIDPIDGTASFVAGLPVWGIALGLVEQNEPVAGFFWMPVSSDFFHTTPEGIVYRNDQPTRIKTPASLHRESVLLSHGRLHRRYTISRGYPGKVRGLGSAIAHLSYVATGSADAVLIGRVRVWDLAAGLAMLLNNGGVLRYLDGTDVSLAQLLSGNAAPLPMLGGHPDVIAQFEPLISYQAPSVP